MKFRARDLPPQPEKPKEVVQPVVIVQQVREPRESPKVDAIKSLETRIMLTLKDLRSKLETAATPKPRVKSWNHKIVRHDSGFIKEIISTPEYEE